MGRQTRPSLSPILQSVHETARDLHSAGLIDLRRMREYDALCLAPIPAYSSSRIRALRSRYWIYFIFLSHAADCRSVIRHSFGPTSASAGTV